MIVKIIKTFEAFVNEGRSTGYRFLQQASGQPDQVPHTEFWTKPIHIVISDPKDGLSSEPNKVKNILGFIERELEKRAEILGVNFKKAGLDDYMRDLKYYEKTDKIVGKLPDWFFFGPVNKIKNSIHSSHLYTSTKDRYPNLQLVLKKSIK